MLRPALCGLEFSNPTAPGMPGTAKPTWLTPDGGFGRVVTCARARAGVPNCSTIERPSAPLLVLRCSTAPAMNPARRRRPLSLVPAAGANPSSDANVAPELAVDTPSDRKPGSPP